MKTKHKHYTVLTAFTLALSGISFASVFGDEKYTYDASGNVLEKQLADQVTRYDYTGNQLTGSDGDAGRKQYQYDSSGRLVSRVEEGKPLRKMDHQYLDKVVKVHDGEKTTEFFYNAEGQLVGSYSAGTAETYAWDGLALINRGAQLYVNEDHAVGGNPAIAGNDVAVSDMFGSSLSVGNESFTATAFGEGLEGGLFTGKPFIEDLGSFIFKHRNYSAALNRWTVSDPMGFPDGENQYIYVGNDPISRVDPLGLYYIDSQETVNHHQSIKAGSIEWVKGDMNFNDLPGNLELEGEFKSQGRKSWNPAGPVITGTGKYICAQSTGDISYVAMGGSTWIVGLSGGKVATGVKNTHRTNNTKIMDIAGFHEGTTETAASVSGGLGMGAVSLSWTGATYLAQATTSGIVFSEQ